MALCGGCNRTFTQVNFSQTQRKKKTADRRCKTCQRGSSVAGPEKQQNEKLVSWLIANQAVISAVHLTGTTYRGLFSAKLKDRGQPILQIPPSCIISLATVQSTEYMQRYVQRDPPLQVQVLIAIYLLYERRDSNSRWTPYLDSLPSNHNTPLFWSPEQRQKLQGTTAETLLLANEDDSWEIYNTLTTINSTFPFVDFCWALTTVTSRIFKYYRDDQPVQGLVPLADMLNHSNNPNCHWSYDAGRQCFVVASSRPIPTHIELCDSYGHKCNSRFLVNYGFTLEDNATYNQAAVYLDLDSLQVEDFKRTQLAVMLKSTRFLDDGFSGCSYLAEKGKYTGKADYRFQLCSRAEMNQSKFVPVLLACLRLVVATVEEIGITFEKPISPRNEKAMVQLLGWLCQQRSQELTGMNTENYRTFRDGLAAYSRERNAATIVLGELEVLQTWVDWCCRASK